MYRHAAAKATFLGLTGGAILLLAAFWLTVLWRPEPLKAGALRDGWWPVACTTRGCITSRSWARHYESATAFAAFSNTPAPTPPDTLTTLLRQHLVREAQLVSPVSLADARRYREEVLRLTDAAVIREATGWSLEDYDQYVLIPLLEQEALRQAQRVESLDELFVQLSGQRRVWVLLNNAWWDPSVGRVTTGD